MRWLAITALVACSAPPSPTVGNRTMTKEPELACEVRFEVWSMQLRLVNTTDVPRRVEYFRPYMDLELTLRDPNGTVRSISQPPIDMPVEKVELVVPPHGKAPLPTPIWLRFSTDVAADVSPFIWRISGAPVPLDVEATLRLDGGRTKLTCRAQI
jgi:hypothetical protein